MEQPCFGCICEMYFDPSKNTNVGYVEKCTWPSKAWRLVPVHFGLLFKKCSSVYCVFLGMCGYSFLKSSMSVRVLKQTKNSIQPVLNYYVCLSTCNLTHNSCSDVLIHMKWKTCHRTFFSEVFFF